MPPSVSAEAYVVLDARDGRILDARNENASALPGSTVKPFVPAVGTAVCRGALTIAGHRLDCTHPAVLGPINGDDALVLSCNHYFASVALRSDPRRMQAALADFEAALAGTTEQRQLQALGYWGVSASPLRLARAYRRLLATAKSRLISGGKTGTTAQAAWYAGWDPADDPKVVVAVMTGGRGAANALPAAREIFKKWSR